MKKLLFTIAFCTAFWAGFAQNNGWLKEPSLPNTLYSPYTFAIGTHVYVIAGIMTFGPQGNFYPAVMSHKVWDFNTVTSSWSQKADFPGTAMYDGKGFAINGYGYVVNGWDSTGSGQGSNALWQYDPTNDTWSQKAPFPGSTRYTTATFVVQNKAFIACGFSPYNNEVYSYDPATDTWTQKSNFPGGARQAATYLTFGNDAYVGLGATGDGRGSYFMQSDWYKYDATNDTWTRMGDFPGDALDATHNFTVDGEGYVVNGLNQNSVYFNTSTAVNTSNKVWKYTPNTDTWSLWGVFPDSSAFDGCSATCGNAGYMGFSAYNFNNFPLSRSFYRFGPSTGPYSCNVTLSKFSISNAVYNFQANGSFSPTAQITWNFGDGATGSGLSVIHNYTTTGHFTVTVNVSDTASSCANSANDTINVTSINNCAVAINYTNYDSLFTLSTAVTQGAGPYTYQWSTTSDSTYSSTSPDPLVTIGHNASKEYCVTVTDNSGCVASACTTIVDSQYFRTPCQMYLVIYPDSSIPGWYTAVLYTSGAPLTYLWDFGDGTTSTDPYPVHTYTTAGRYTICLTVSDGAGCSFTFCDSSFYAFKYGGGPMNHFRVSKRTMLGTKDISTANSIAVYPNPTNALLTIDAAGQKVDYAFIYNIAGQKVIEVSNPIQNNLSVSQLPDGMYIIEVKTKNELSRIKFTKLSK